MQGFNELVQLLAHLRKNPWAEELLTDQYPKHMEQVRSIMRAPFFRYAPFGYYNGVSFGGYRSDGTNPCQVGVLASKARNKWVTAGNRSGKSLCGCMEDFADCIHLNPITKLPDPIGEGGRFSNVDVRIWVISDTEETAINGVERIFYEDVLGTDESGALWNFITDNCKYSDRGGWSGHRITFTNGSWIQFKFSTQGRKTFQGVSLDKVHEDEVQPQPIHSESAARLTDRNGYLLGTMTPLDDKGVPWIYEELYIPRAEKNIEFHQWSMHDNPHLSEEGRARLIQQWDEDEIEARVYGSFVPIGQRLAVPHRVLRQLKEQALTQPAARGLFYYNESGKAAFSEQEA